MKDEKKFEEGLKLIILAIKVLKPTATDKEVENMIVNLGNYIQLKRITKENEELRNKLKENV